MTDTHRALADLLFPHGTTTPTDWLAQYPPRALPAGALVTRFAPSPTGFVHIGSIMTALVARTVAQQSGGAFLLRIEDTDKKRQQDKSVEEIVRNLINFDLMPDEGIVQVEPTEREVGDYAPYTQSERVAMYESFAYDLVARGLAYPAFDTEEELERTRKLQEAQRVRPGYYGAWAKWRTASLADVQARIEAGERPVIRVRAPYPNETRFKISDVVKGDLDLPANDVDAVILKSNSLPTYHFAHVVDDTLMRVNLITRGDEWLPSLPLHVQLFEAVGQPIPRYAHIAPIAKLDGSSKRKLSKRKDPEANVMYFYETGYPVQAVAEYLLNLVNSDFYEWRKAHPTTPYSAFALKLESMNNSSALFDLIKLNDISKDVIASYSAEQVYEYGLAWAEEHDPELARIMATDLPYTLAVFNVERFGDAPRKDIVNWSDLRRACGFFWDEAFAAEIATSGYPQPERFDPADVGAVLDYVRAFDLTRSKDDWLTEMRALSEQLGYASNVKSYKKTPDAFKGHFGDVMMLVRVALTGRTNTPDLYEVLQVYGTARIHARLDWAVQALGQNA